jgi:hypothetical protein
MPLYSHDLLRINNTRLALLCNESRLNSRLEMKRVGEGERMSEREKHGIGKKARVR